LDGIWTVSQRRGLIALLLGITAILAIRLLLNRQTIPDPQPAEGPAAGEVQDRLDPNVASAAELAAIPGVGEKRAEAIVDYRDHYLQDHPGGVAFPAQIDLLRVSGIGAGVSESMEPYLIFPGQSTSRP
jgi:competence ComEA-like helix-hairpin-helix protein